MRDEFSVYQFFPDDSYEPLAGFVSAEEAIQIARKYVTNVAARIGITKRVIITDGGDQIVWEWQHGKGVTWPTENNLSG